MVLVAVLGLTPLLAMEIHSGKVLAVGKDYVTVRDKMDMDDDRIFVTAETKITRNGKAARLSDIGIGDLARVDAKEADGKLIAVTIDAMMPE
jgi:hypothetical protein